MNMQRSLVLFAMVAVVALFAVTSMPLLVSQQAAIAAVHHKAHTASSQVFTTVTVHHKVHTASKGKVSVHQVAVIPETHGIPLLNATALKKEISKEVKGPYGEKDVLGGMMSGGY
jgi:hypothetical protein